MYTKICSRRQCWAKQVYCGVYDKNVLSMKLQLLPDQARLAFALWSWNGATVEEERKGANSLHFFHWLLYIMGSSRGVQAAWFDDLIWWFDQKQAWFDLTMIWFDKKFDHVIWLEIWFDQNSIKVIWFEIWPDLMRFHWTPCCCVHLRLLTTH